MNTVCKTAALVASLALLTACGGGSNVKGDGAGDAAALAAGSGNGSSANNNGSDGSAANGNGEFGYGSGGITDGAENGSLTGVESQFSGLNDPASPLYTRVIYFDYNATDIAPEYQNALLAHAQLLADNPDVRFRLEGHTDERGSREYNIGLGNRRATAVGQFMQQRGITPQQIEIVSYGEEKPARLEHNSAAWKLNRRVELVYVGY